MQKLFDLFEEVGLPYHRQGSLANQEYPPSFFTFWNIDTTNESFYDDKEHRYIEYVQVGFYTNDATKIYSVMDDFIQRAEAKGFVVVGRARDADADDVNYFGRVCHLRIINNI